ncbi:MAG: hypothetical protein WC777_03220 [Candidatus Gracilibacteria bacterium]|jgi:hypothetical protein
MAYNPLEDPNLVDFREHYNHELTEEDRSRLHRENFEGMDCSRSEGPRVDYGEGGRVNLDPALREVPGASDEVRRSVRGTRILPE